MRIAFCVRGVSEEVLQRTEFYRQDREILRSLGHEVEYVGAFSQINKRFDLAFVWWWNYCWGWGPAAKLAGLPVVTTGVFDLDQQSALPFYKRVLKQWGARFSDINVFVSREEFERVPRTVKLKSGSVHYSPLVVDTALYNPAPGVGPGAGPVTIANVSWQRMTNMRRKMVPELLEAFSLVLQDGGDLRLVLAGPPEDGCEFLKERSKELGISERVGFPGELSREDKIALMRRASLYCQVSRYEGFGLAIAEAMACGAPVLVSDVGAVSEVVGDCGTYVHEVSVDGILQGLRVCLADLQKCRENAARGVLRIRELFSVDRRRADLKRFLEEALQASER